MKAGPLRRTRSEIDLGPCCLDRLTALLETWPPTDGVRRTAASKAEAKANGATKAG